MREAVDQQVLIAARRRGWGSATRCCARSSRRPAARASAATCTWRSRARCTRGAMGGEIELERRRDRQPLCGRRRPARRAARDRAGRPGRPRRPRARRDRRPRRARARAVAAGAGRVDACCRPRPRRAAHVAAEAHARRWRSRARRGPAPTALEELDPRVDPRRYAALLGQARADCSGRSTGVTRGWRRRGARWPCSPMTRSAGTRALWRGSRGHASCGAASAMRSSDGEEALTEAVAMRRPARAGRRPEHARDGADRARHVEQGEEDLRGALDHRQGARGRRRDRQRLFQSVERLNVVGRTHEALGDRSRGSGCHPAPRDPEPGLDRLTLADVEFESRRLACRARAQLDSRVRALVGHGADVPPAP